MPKRGAGNKTSRRSTRDKYRELKQRQQQEFNALPLGIVYNEKQFARMMEGWGLSPEKDTDKIYSLAGGSYIKKKNAELEAAIVEDTTGDGFIYDMFLCELSLVMMAVWSLPVWSPEPLCWCGRSRCRTV